MLSNADNAAVKLVFLSSIVVKICNFNVICARDIFPSFCTICILLLFFICIIVYLLIKADEKRARLLDNAAKESRDRRAKDEAEGRPASRPFDAVPKREDTKPQLKPTPESPSEDATPENTGSTLNLLGNPGKSSPPAGAGAGGESPVDDGGDPSGMSINEILKRKMQDKKKPKKVVAS